MTQAGIDPIAAVRAEFPILAREVRGRRLVYLDSAATSQKPNSVIEAVADFTRNENASVHRGVHELSQEATRRYEETRQRASRFLGAAKPEEIVFTKGCTESVNLVAQSFARPRLRPGDVVLLTEMEHHSNIVPWQMVAEATGAVVRAAPIDDRGVLDLEALRRMLDGRVKIVGVMHVSNALGTINPVKEVVAMAHAVGAHVLVDGAQAGPHLRVDVQDLDADFYTTSGHKAYGPTGIAALYVRESILESMPPYQGGGSMIRTVSFDGTTYAPIPDRFEAGTPNVQGVVGLGASMEFLEGLGDASASDRLLDAFARIARFERTLQEAAQAALAEVPGVRIVGTAPEKSAVVSFVMEQAHPHDIGTILDAEGIAVRAGHHCCMPLMKRMGVPATARASFGIYNTLEDVEALVQGVRKVAEVFG